MFNCKQCNQSFEIDVKDRIFYDKMNLSDPKMCPRCRMQRRILFRNFMNLYHRKCDLSGKQMISMYDEDVLFPVYEMNEWWSDKWDDLGSGIEIDWNKSIFDHMKIIHETAPRMGILNTQCENTDYSNMSFGSRNCYLVFGNVFNESCYYGHIVWRSKNCFDCLYTYKSEQCYECTDCVQCYNLAYCSACDNCSDSKFLVNCMGCRDCFGCVGLKNKQYHIFNESHTKEEYEAKMKEFNSGDVKLIDIAKSKVKELQGKEIVKNFHGFGSENVTGDYLYNCKNTFDSYDSKNCEDSRYLATAESFVNCYDCNYSPDVTEWSYNCVAVSGNMLLGCHTSTQGADLYYCDNCFSSKDCFGCVGLKSKRYCIFNKQYTKQQYEDLLPQLIEKMKKEGDFGEFVPATFSPFAYNETMAYEYFPLSKQEALSQGYRWKDDLDVTENYKGPAYDVPDDIKDVSDDIVKKVLICEGSGKAYKIIPQELAFYRENNLPIPQKSWYQRYKDRMKLRNPRVLCNRQCAKCNEGVRTTYSEDRPETVYCEPCYLKEVY